jgi:hypothetical protein
MFVVAFEGVWWAWKLVVLFVLELFFVCQKLCWLERNAEGLSVQYVLGFGVVVSLVVVCSCEVVAVVVLSWYLRAASLPTFSLR